MLKMSTYPGMTLGGEVRESISLDEDDLSDVEDEVFIRDGKNSYKMAEELNVKRPLMAPRRKCRSEITTRLKGKPPCRTFCKPCCYMLAALSVLIGLIGLVIVLVSIYPLPLDKLRNWVIARTLPLHTPVKLLPCSTLRTTDVWTVNLPILTTDSPVRTLDVNGDGIDDVIFGFGTGDDNYHTLPPQTFCPVFLGVAPPCEGGVLALNGATGDILWRFWANDTIFGIQCGADLNGDGGVDCVGMGVKGTLVALDGRNGTVIWRNSGGIFVANFVKDLDNDTVADVLSSYASLEDKEGFVIIFSGKTGKQVRQIDIGGSKTFFMPQLFKLNGTDYVLIGTGSPTTPGTLSVVPLEALKNGNFSAGTKIYEDHYKGILTQSVLVDITGDNITDIITALSNSTVVAINGANFTEIWNFTIPNSETNITPTPGYFNEDNVTDFLITYQTYDAVFHENYTKTFVVDGKTGRSIYSKAIANRVATQMSGLTLSMEQHGFDMYLFWTTERIKSDELGKDGEAREKFNTTNILKLNALNQFDQPPGFELYNSARRVSVEFNNNTKSPLKQIREYLVKHPKFHIEDDDTNSEDYNLRKGQSEVGENYMEDSVAPENEKVLIHKYGSSSFRHKDNNQGIVKDFMTDNENNRNIDVGEIIEPKYDSNCYTWPVSQVQNTIPSDFETGFGTNYNQDDFNLNANNNQKQTLFDENNNNRMLQRQKPQQRDPRSKIKTEKFDQEPSTTKKKNLSADGIYGYKNIQKAHDRLLHDLNDPPSTILRDTYFKNRERQLKKSRLESRDLDSHNKKDDVKKIIEKEMKMAENASALNLWDLESEKEGFVRTKRNINYTAGAIGRATSVGAVLDSLNSTNSIDIVFVTYWQPSRPEARYNLARDIVECVEEKMRSGDQPYQKNTEDEQRSLYKRECITEQDNLKQIFPFFNELYQLSLGQMTVYRIRVECQCNAESSKMERCAKFRSGTDQSWPNYLGKMGDGIFTHLHNEQMKNGK